MIEKLSRFCSYEELERLFLRAFDAVEKNRLPEADIANDFLCSLCNGIASTLGDHGYLPKEAGWLSSFFELAELISDNDFLFYGDREFERVAELVDIGVALELNISAGSSVPVAILAMQMGALLTDRPIEHNANWLSYAEFEILTGPYPEVEDMNTASKGRRFLSVIEKCREVFGSQPFPLWKVEQVKLIKDAGIRLCVDGKAGRISASTPSDKIISLAKSFISASTSRKLLSHQEIFAVYGIIYSFFGLSTLQRSVAPCAESVRLGLVSKVEVLLVEAEGFRQLVAAATKLRVLSEQNSANSEGETKKKEALIAGLQSITKKKGVTLTKGQLKKFLSGHPLDDPFETGNRLCPNLFSGEVVSASGDVREGICFSYRCAFEQEEVQEGFVTYETYRTGYLPVLKKGVKKQ